MTRETAQIIVQNINDITGMINNKNEKARIKALVPVLTAFYQGKTIGLRGIDVETDDIGECPCFNSAGEYYVVTTVIRTVVDGVTYEINLDQAVGAGYAVKV